MAKKFLSLKSIACKGLQGQELVLPYFGVILKTRETMSDTLIINKELKLELFSKLGTS